MQSLQDRLSRAKDMKRYLAELSVLLRREVREPDLMPVDETVALLAASPPSAMWSVDVPFAETQSARFRLFIESLARLNPSPVRLWLPPANYCGLSPAISLTDVDFEFDFDLSLDGIFSVHTIDRRDRLLLDYYEERGELRLEVQVSGHTWSTARL
jgi:hypothetical protein